MLKKYVYFPLCAGAFASLVTLVYSLQYQEAMKIEGSSLESLRSIIPQFNMLFAPFVGCFVAAAGYFTLKKWLVKYAEFIFYFLFSSATVLSSLFIIMKMASSYDVDPSIEEIIYGYTIPMHFFPFLSWVTFKSLFFQDQK